jgi:MFS transporter, CP family, cyanate transporter
MSTMVEEKVMDVSVPVVGKTTVAETVVKSQAGEYTKYRFLIEVMMFLTYSFFGAAWAAGGIFLMPMMSELNLPLTHASFITNIVSLAQIFAPALAGYFAGRLGLRWGFMAASIFICFGILSPLSTTFTFILLARFIMGLGGGMIPVYFAPLVMVWFPENERIVANGFNAVSVNTGIALGLLTTPSLQTYFDGDWRKVLLLFSSISLVLAVTWLFLGRERKETSQAASRVDSASDKDTTQKKYTYLDAAKDMNTWKLILTYMGILSLYLTIFTYFPSYYKQIFGENINPLLLRAPGITMFTGIPAALIGMALSKKTGLRVPFLKYSGLLLVPGVLGMFITANPVIILASAVVVGACMFIGVSAYLTIPQELPGMTAEKTGYMMGIFWASSYIAATFSVWFVGWLASTFDYKVGFFYIAAFSACQFIGSSMLPETGPGAKKKQEELAAVTG